jgi:hypothetical protein
MRSSFQKYNHAITLKGKYALVFVTDTLLLTRRDKQEAYKFGLIATNGYI